MPRADTLPHLAALPMPVHLMIGNHDSRTAFQAAFPAAPVDGAGFVQQAFGAEAGRFILLDAHKLGRAEGTLCRRRLDWLAAELRADQAAPLFLFLHHPPFRVGLQRMDHIRLLDGGPLLDTLRPHLPRVRHLFIGHLHRMVAGSWHGIPFSGVRGTSHQIALDFVPPDVAPVSFEAPCHGVVLLSPEAVVAHHGEVAAGALLQTLALSVGWVLWKGATASCRTSRDVTSKVRSCSKRSVGIANME